MSSIQVHATGLIYKNPRPHVRSIHAYFPSVVLLGHDEMLATVVLGEAFEASNLHTQVCRSRDLGRTWQLEGPLYPGTPDRLTSDSARVTAMPDGEIVVFMVRLDRTAHADEGMTNPDTLGFVPTELLLLRSRDRGHTWSGPAPLVPSLVGPAFEICCPVIPLRDGRWLIPTQTWPGWNGDCPHGVRMVALVSHDRGQSWPEYLQVMRASQGQVFFWESKILELADGRLLAVAWAYDDIAKKDRPNQYALSRDGGRTWSAPASMGIQGQTLAPLLLDDGRILCVYRRMDKSGLWATVAEVDKDRWVNVDEAPLWGAGAQGLTASTQDMSHNFNVLRFGAPCLTRLPDGTIFLAFWCYEECISVIRWFRITI